MSAGILRLEVDYSRFNAAVKKFAELTGRPLNDVFKDEMALLLRSLIYRTPPKSMERGQKNISGDVSKVVKIERGGLVDWMQANNRAQAPGMRVHFWKHGSRQTYIYPNWSRDPQDVQSWWSSTPRSRKEKALPAWRKMLTVATAATPLKNTLFARLGRMKAAWTAALRALNRPTVRETRSWITRHGDGPGRGKLEEAVDLVVIESTNTAPGVTQLSRVVQQAVEGRRRMLVSKILYEIGRRAADSGLK